MNFAYFLYNNQDITLIPKSSSLSVLHISVVNDYPNLPRAFIAMICNRRDYEGSTTVHFNLSVFISMCKAIVKFRKYGITTNQFQAGRRSFICYTATGNRNKPLVLHCCNAINSVRMDYILDRRMLRSFCKQYKPLYKYATQLVKSLSDSEISIF